jgi:type VI protein secretion system component VasK
MSNQIAAGSMILIIHDASDILIAFGRFFVETIYPSKRVNSMIYVVMTAIWIWMRIIVFPFCLLSYVYMNRPAPKDDWAMISFEYDYLLTMAFILYGMHLFWTFLIIKIGIKSTGNQGFENFHDKKIKQ